MEFFPQLVLAHVGFAYISLILLLTRGVLASKMVDWRQYKILRIAPHLIDTLLLVSGIILLVILLSNGIYALNEMQWLIPKIAFLVLYIVFSAKAFKKSQPFSLKNFILAVISFMLTMLVATLR
ncbi:SirB2 family protein [Actinobacillus equuli subsp. equuli]|uniref:Invasion gene expression up-regulator SirB n=1 Tax=Actinobacillus equuli TaxID=718 RepID=A0AAX3FQ93_ACTEU|nr:MULTISPECIES: SirB2 family protein [Actinobacillus]AIZ78833.1 invasion protein expression up-regulator SirB [Actinobacillus equuli subsp. equuli]WGE43002.1 SirB2 family protein [Actinobacillus equuli subsp. haemolyticus]WGE45091.1 SirB2 family protein [Actinobacillus equuli subsp. equuli]WGE49286.1 SirB2 family protein [Actinobacillus equuli subsp. equuli]WGE51614.1 SirB2 family protein [Actinobacillus equuli subsp. haemolyticus]